MSKPTMDAMSELKTERVIPNTTVLTFDGVSGFAWIDKYGVRHDEGFTWPELRITHNATVKIDTDPETGKRIATYYAAPGQMFND